MERAVRSSEGRYECRVSPVSPPGFSWSSHTRSGKLNCFRIHIHTNKRPRDGSDSAPRRPLTQGYDVRGEAVSQQDASVPLAVQLRYEPVPVDDQTRTKPADGRERCVLLKNTHTKPSEGTSTFNISRDCAQQWRTNVSNRIRYTVTLRKK